AMGVLVLQYRWRRTWAARALFAAALVAGLSASFLPWRTTFGLVQVLTARSRDAHGINVAFAPEGGRFRPAPGQGLDDVQEKPGIGAADVAEENQRRRAEGALTVFFPLRVSGPVSGSRLLADRSDVTLTGRDGRILYRGTGNDFELRATGVDATLHQAIRVPGAIYQRIREHVLD